MTPTREIISAYFIPKLLMQYLSEARTPLYHIKNPEGQSNDVPAVLEHSSRRRYHQYDSRKPGAARPRAHFHSPLPSEHKSTAEYPGLDSDPCCQGLLEQASPKSTCRSEVARRLIRRGEFRIALPATSSRSPDVADAEAFWAWFPTIPCDRDDTEKWLNVAKEAAQLFGHESAMSEVVVESANFNEMVQRELVELYGWQTEDFESGGLGGTLIGILRGPKHATGEHFGIKRKASTYAWAYDVARRLLRESLAVASFWPDAEASRELRI